MATAEPTLEQLIGRSDPPPLRIHHIMVATAVIAVLLSIMRSSRQTDSFGSFSTSVQAITMAISVGLAATLVGFGFSWKRRGYLFLGQPGHWLLLTQALMICFFVMAAAISVMRLPSNQSTSGVMGRLLVLIHIANVGLNLWVARRVADSIPWSLIFLIDGLTVVLLFGGSWLGFPGLFFIVIWGAPLATLALLLLAAWSDQRDHIHRDWPHWLGVCLRLVVALQVLS